MNFITGIWFDLKERRLLPVAGVLLIALLAVPILLLKPASEAPEPVVGVETDTAPFPVAATAEGNTDDSNLEVFSSKDPFKPIRELADRNGKADGNGSGGSGSGDPGASTGGSSVSTGSASGSSGSTSGSGGSGTTTTPSDSGSGGDSTPAPTPPTPSPAPPPAPKTYTYTVDLRFGEGERPPLRRDVPRLTPLPNDRNPQIVFLGVTADHKEAVFLVDSGLQQDGEGVCKPTKRDCTFLHLTVGDFQDDHLFYDPTTDRNYRLTLESINRVPVERAARQAAASRAAARRSSTGSADPRPFYSLLFGDETQ